MAHTGQLTSGNPLPDWNDEFQVMAEKFIMLASQGFNASGGGGIPIAEGSTGPVQTLDDGPAWTSSHGLTQGGKAGIPFTSADQHSAAAACTDDPANGKGLVITDLIISVDTQMSVKLLDSGTGAIVWGPHFFSANSGPVQNTPRSQLKLSAGSVLQVQTSVAGNVTVDAYYHSA